VVIESFGNGGLLHEGRDLLFKIQELTEAGIPVIMT
jgi:L-asparaginase